MHAGMAEAQSRSFSNRTSEPPGRDGEGNKKTLREANASHRAPIADS